MSGVRRVSVQQRRKERQKEKERPRGRSIRRKGDVQTTSCGHFWTMSHIQSKREPPAGRQAALHPPAIQSAKVCFGFCGRAKCCAPRVLAPPPREDAAITSPPSVCADVHILIGVGAVMMFVGFLGCYGAIQESQCLLGTVSHRPWCLPLLLTQVTSAGPCSLFSSPCPVVLRLPGHPVCLRGRSRNLGLHEQRDCE